MYAIEFQTSVKEGQITIPREHWDKLKGQVRVILLAEDREEGFDFIEHLFAHPPDVPKFTPLTREEIYEQP